MRPTPDNPSAAPRSYLFFLIIIACLGAFSSLINDMYLPTVPAIMREFHTTPAVTQLGLTMAMVGMAFGAGVWGSLSDKYGRKTILLASLIIFCVGTAISLFSNNITFFVSCRFVMGFGGGGAVVLSRSIPTDIYSGRNLAVIMALVGAINGIAPAAGPLLGGFLAKAVGWRGIFVVLLAIGIIMIFAGFRMKESLVPSKREHGKGLREYLAAYRALFSNRRFMIYVLVKGAAIGLLYAYISSAPFIIQDHFHFSAIAFGAIIGANAIAIALGSMAAVRFKILKQAIVAGIVGMFVFAIADAIVFLTHPSILWYELFSVPMLFFSGMIYSGSNTLAMEAGNSDAGTASAILSIVKYAFAGIAAPLVGIGIIFHATAWVFIAYSTLTLIIGYFAYRLTPMADMIRKD